MQAFLDKKEFPPRDAAKDGENTNASDSPSSYHYATKEDIPTPQEILDIQEETKELRTKLRAARRRKKQLFGQLEKLAEADETAKMASRALQDSTNVKDFEKVRESVTAVIMGKQGLEALYKDGIELAEKLNQEKRERPEEDDDLVVEPKQKKLTLDEEYELSKKLIDMTTEGMKEFNKLLKHL